MKEKITIVVPCYNEQEALPYFYPEFVKVSELMSEQDFELLLVDDGSKDGTLNYIKELASKDERVKYISFSRNFGKESAIYAGLKNASGDYVTLMDADLQDPPSLLPEMFKAIKEEGYDSVATRRVTRKGEPPIRSFFARKFYKIMNKISDAELVDGARDYRLMTRKVVNAVLSMSEYNRFTKGIFGWVGFKTKWLEYENIERVSGETKWSFFKLLKYAISGIIAFSNAPLKIATGFGIFFTFASFFGAIATLIVDLCGIGVSPFLYLGEGIGFVSGLIMLLLGVLGEYVAKIHLEVKNRPVYICQDTNINDQENNK
ncbi:MAG: glycosyltransferase family 2 protein [Clostridia bacterium]|nr:glycosyltransferase family 2 protein [Clostridia bacterium]